MLKLRLVCRQPPAPREPRSSAAEDLILESDELRRRDFSRILLIKLSAVGDVIHTFPVLNKLRRRYPTARIDWLIKPAMADLVRHHPGVNDVLLFAQDEWAKPWRNGFSGVRSFTKLAAHIRAARYDLVIDLQGQLRSAVFARLSGAPVRIGFDRPRASVWQASQRALPAEAYKHCWRGAREGAWLAYTHRIRVPTLDLHAVDRNLMVAPMLGIDDGGVDFSFVIPPTAAAKVDRLLHDHGLDAAAGSRLVFIAPGTIWETKHWTPEGFASVARYFLGRGFSVALTGSAREMDACNAVAQAAPGSVNLAGRTTLTELAALVRRSAIVLSNDSGPMHIAVALGRPVVSIFGPTDPLWAGPYRQPDAAVSAGLACSPCYLRLLRRCPHGHACMSSISSEAVTALMEKNLAETSVRPSMPTTMSLAG